MATFELSPVPNQMMTIGARAMIGIEPDLTFVIDLDPDVALARGLARKSGEDRFESLGAGFQHRLRAGYLALAAQFPHRVRVIPGDASPEQVALYARLVALPGHVESTLGMMAQWSLDDLLARLPQMAVPLLLIAGAKDVAVPPEVSRKVAAQKPGTVYAELPGLGHLAHEEAPADVAARILPFLAVHLRRMPAA